MDAFYNSMASSLGYFEEQESNKKDSKDDVASLFDQSEEEEEHSSTTTSSITEEHFKPAGALDESPNKNRGTVDSCTPSIVPEDTRFRMRVLDAIHKRYPLLEWRFLLSLASFIDCPPPGRASETPPYCEEAAIAWLAAENAAKTQIEGNAVGSNQLSAKLGQKEQKAHDGMLLSVAGCNSFPLSLFFSCVAR